MSLKAHKTCIFSFYFCFQKTQFDYRIKIKFYYKTVSIYLEQNSVEYTVEILD